MPETEVTVAVLESASGNTEDEIKETPLRRSRRTSASSTGSKGPKSPGRRPLKSAKLDEKKGALQNFFSYLS